MATLSRKAYGSWLFQRMLQRAIIVVGLLLIVAILLGALLVGLLLSAHTTLLHSGLTPSMAMLVISIFTLVIVGLLLLLAQHYARQLPQMLAPQSPITARVGGIFNAFMDGFMEK